MAIEPLAWLLTYGIHSTLFLGGAWLISLILPDRARVLRETTWKAALVGAFITASFQVANPTPSSGELTVRVGPPTNVSPSGSPSASDSDRVSAAADVESASKQECTDSQLLSASSDVLPTSSGIVSDSELTESFDANGAASGFDRLLAAAGALPEIGTWSGSFLRNQHLGIPSQVMLGFGVLWMLVALFGSFRIIRAHFSLRRRLRDRMELKDGAVSRTLARLRRRAGIRQSIRLTECDAIAGPMAIGLSEICVPSRALTELSEKELEALLAHELGHLVRRDPLWAMVSFAIENLFLLQPLNRLARRRIQREAEYLADDWAIEQTGSGFSLARCLATVAGWVAGTKELRTASAMAGSGSALMGRVERLLEGGPRRPARLLRWVRVPAAVALLLVVALLAPEVTAKVAGPRKKGIVPLPPGHGLAHLGDDFDRYTIRVEEDEAGLIEVRIEDDEVVGVRLDGEKVPEDRYSVENDFLLLRDESGNEIAEVDLDVRSRIARGDGSIRGPQPLPHVSHRDMAELRDRVRVFELDGKALRHGVRIHPDAHRRASEMARRQVDQIRRQIDRDTIRRALEGMRLDPDDLRRSIEGGLAVDELERLDQEIEEEVRRSLADARIELYDIHQLMDEVHEWDGDEESEAELRAEIESSFEGARETIEDLVGDLREEIEETDDLDEEERSEALDELETEREEVLEELDREKERVLHRLEQRGERMRERERNLDGSDSGHSSAPEANAYFAALEDGAVPRVMALKGSDGHLWVLRDGEIAGRLAPGVYSVSSDRVIKLRESDGPWIVGRAGSRTEAERYRVETERGRRELERARRELDRLRKRMEKRGVRDRSEAMETPTSPLPPDVQVAPRVHVSSLDSTPDAPVAPFSAFVEATPSPVVTPDAEVAPFSATVEVTPSPVVTPDTPIAPFSATVEITPAPVAIPDVSVAPFAAFVEATPSPVVTPDAPVPPSRMRR